MPTWTSEQVASLAPDAGSVAAASGLASPRVWSSTGMDDRAVWGRCRGYSVAIDVAGPERPSERGAGPERPSERGAGPERPSERGAGPERPSERGAGPAFTCTCPSRKIPCKHGLGLLMLWASHPETVAGPAEAPAWVEDWLAGRARRAARAPAGPKPPDPEARAKRMAERAARIGAGLEELDLWLRDLVRQGLASAQGRPFGYWDEMGARMVDAQAPGVGGQVRRMAGTIRSGDGWPGRFLLQAGRLHLLAEAWSRYDALPPETRADLRTVAGWSWTSEEVLAGPTVRDRWSVVARSVADEERFRIVRTWLVASERTAMILEFVPVHEPLPGGPAVGTTVDADLAYFPGAWPQRALVSTTHGDAGPMAEWHGWSTLEGALAEQARALAANPWLDRLPMVLSGVVPAGELRVRDGTGASVPLLVDEAAWWKLVAVSGGRPVGLAGEWQDGALRALSAWADRRLTPLV